MNKSLVVKKLIEISQRETFAREYARVKMVKIHLIFVEKLANS